MSFDFSQIAVPFRMQPGLRRVAPGSRQLTPTRAGGRHFYEKMAVLASSASRALAAVPGFDALPVLSAIAAEASMEEAPAFVRRGTAGFGAPRLGWSVDDDVVRGDGDPAIGKLLASLPAAQRATALLCLAFEEDFAVIDGNDATIPWLAVCLPSRWAPEEKLGLHFAQVHSPVADNVLLVSASEQLARLVTGRDRWERIVWTVTPDARLQQHPARGLEPWSASADEEAIGAQAVFRHEYQSFIPLPSERRAVFTIRIASEPLASALRSREDASTLRAALSSMSPSVLVYRGLDEVREPLLAWLARRVDDLPARAP